MEKNLLVVYKSQWDNDAVISKNDCGAAAVASILNYYGENLTTDQIQKDTGAGGGLVKIDQILNAVSKHGYRGEFRTNQTFDQLKELINNDTPVIVLVHYGSLISTQDKNFKGGHFMTVVGYRADNGVYVNDPNFRDEFRQDGDHHLYTYEEFMQSWKDCTIDQNPVNSMIVIHRNEVVASEAQVTPEPTVTEAEAVSEPEVVEKPAVPAKVKVTPEIGLKGRTEPVTNSTNVAKIFSKNTELEVVGSVVGDEINGNKVWYELKTNPVIFVWSGGVEEIIAKADKPKEAKPKEEKAKAINANVVIPKQDVYLQAVTTIYQLTHDILKANNRLPVEKPGFWDSLKKSLHI